MNSVYISIQGIVFSDYDSREKKLMTYLFHVIINWYKQNYSCYKQMFIHITVTAVKSVTPVVGITMYRFITS